MVAAVGQAGVAMSNGKGSVQRPGDRQAYAEGWERVFGQPVVSRPSETTGPVVKPPESP